MYSVQYNLAETVLQMNLKGKWRVIEMKANGDFLNRVHSDQMVLEIDRWETKLHA
jgi:hypothetical protein